MKTGEKELMEAAGRYPELAVLRKRLRDARHRAEDDGAWPRRSTAQQMAQAAYDSAFNKLKDAVSRRAAESTTKGGEK